MRRVVVGITGASGAIYGIRFLQLLRAIDGVEPHLIISEAGKRTIVEETDWSVRDVEGLAARRYDNKDIGAALASGTFKTDGMVVVPCSIKTAAAVAHCLANTLVARAADVTLKEGRRLVLVVRETPLHLGHLRVLTGLAEMGAVLLPPMPAFYNRPKQIEDLIDHTLARVLDRLGFPQELVPEWEGKSPGGRSAGTPPREKRPTSRSGRPRPSRARRPRVARGLGPPLHAAPQTRRRPLGSRLALLVPPNAQY